MRLPKRGSNSAVIAHFLAVFKLSGPMRQRIVPNIAVGRLPANGETKRRSPGARGSFANTEVSEPGCRARSRRFIHCTSGGTESLALIRIEIKHVSAAVQS